MNALEDSANIDLVGRGVRLEALSERHIAGLVGAAAGDRSAYDWSIVPDGERQMDTYVKAARYARERGSAVPFAIVRTADDAIVGSTRFCNLDRWPWPSGHVRHRHEHPDTGEIGFTWLSGAAQRTGINTEAKLLLLTHAFETWNMASVCLHTDVRNARSRAAMERIGATYEGTLHAHRMAIDYVPRDSARYVFVGSAWPETKKHLQKLVDR